MKSIVKKVRFIFENRTLKGELCSTKTVSFFKFMDMDRIDDNFVFPFDYELYFTIIIYKVYNYNLQFVISGFPC